MEKLTWLKKSKVLKQQARTSLWSSLVLHGFMFMGMTASKAEKAGNCFIVKILRAAFGGIEI